LAVQQNPFEYWDDERDRADYRSKQTQASSLTRQMLRQPEYFRNRNRVNPGPGRNKRADQADLAGQSAHVTWNEDVWGWQAWSERRRQLSESLHSDNLLEENTINPIDQESYEDFNQPVTVSLPVIVPPEPVVPQTPSSVLTVRNNLKSVEYDQIDPRRTWTITHNLGYYPSVELFSDDWNEIDGYVVHITRNTLRVEFNLPISGHARLI
jgi:hypothetical protein